LLKKVLIKSFIQMYWSLIIH